METGPLMIRNHIAMSLLNDDYGISLALEGWGELSIQIISVAGNIIF